eukprot:4195122-Pyramimonas_sp.AAC.1
MDSILGPIKSEAWRSSNKLQKRADPITGSDAEHLKEYRVPKDIQTLDEDVIKRWLETGTLEGKDAEDAAGG